MSSMDAQQQVDSWLGPLTEAEQAELAKFAAQFDADANEAAADLAAVLLASATLALVAVAAILNWAWL
jgi:hypothetical protein